MDLLGVEFGTWDPPRREVGDLVGVHEIASDQGQQSVVADTEIVSCLLAREDVFGGDLPGFSNAVLSAESLHPSQIHGFSPTDFPDLHANC